MSNFGAKKGFGGGFSAPRQIIANDDMPLVADSTAQGNVRYVIPGTNDPVSPIASDMYNKGGVYIGKSSLDKWRFSLNPKKQIVVFGDSTAQGSVGGYDGWPERLSRIVGNKMGPRVTTGAGFYGLYRSGSSLSSTNSDSDWYGYGVWATTSYSAAYDLAPLFGTYTALNASVTAVKTYADTVTTINSRSVTSAAAAVWVAGDVGALITGTNIPPNTYITSRISNTSITISQPAYATGAGLSSTTHGSTLAWTRPISTNIRAQLCWASATTNASPTITTLNANYGSGVNGSHVNAMITGTNIPAYTTITAWVSYTSVTLSQNCTATTTGYTGYNIVHDGRTVSDLATTNASATITSATASFTSSDVSSKVVGENIPAGTYILSVETPTSATISANATATASAKFLFIQNENAARYVDDLVTTASSPIVTSASAAFTQEDVGRQVTGTNIPNNTVISSVTSNTTAVLTNNIAVSSTLGFLGIAAITSTDVAQVDLITCNGLVNNGANYTYSTDGGNTWVAVTQTAAVPVHILNTSVYVVNPNTVIVRANTSAGVKSQMVFYGLFAYQQANASSGVCLYNIARDGWTLSQTGLSWGGDEMSFFDNSLANSSTSTAWHGLLPDLFIVMYTNDAYSAVGGRQHWWNAINRTISRVNSYADILFISAFDQGLPRDSDTQRQFATILKRAALSTDQTYWYADDGVGDGTTSFTSASIEFVKSDIGKTIMGLGIPTGTTIVSLTNADVAVLSNAVPISANVPFRILGNTPDTPAAVLDLYEAWAADGYRGFVVNGTATGSSQRLQEFLHESQLGHNDIARRVAILLEGY